MPPLTPLDRQLLAEISTRVDDPGARSVLDRLAAEPAPTPPAPDDPDDPPTLSLQERLERIKARTKIQ